jgi:hypothetical protein
VIGKSRLFVTIYDSIRIIDPATHLSDLQLLLENYGDHFGIFFKNKDDSKGALKEKNPLLLARPYKFQLFPLYFFSYIYLDLHIFHAFVLLNFLPILINNII